MSNGVRVGSDSETPVNPYTLVVAVNSSSETARTSWLLYLAIMAWLAIAIAGVTHLDLLLQAPVVLPLMQIALPQRLFFELAPVLLVLVHLGLLSQLVLLARKTLEFDHAVRALEMSDHRTHPLRLELHNFFFVQATAGPQRSIVVAGLLDLVGWLTVAVAPIAILLAIQATYVPYHDLSITWLHRVCVLADCLMLALSGIFLVRAESSLFAAFWRAALFHPVSLLLGAAMIVAAAGASLLVATVPGETLDGIGATLPGGTTVHGPGGEPRRAFLLGGFERNLVVTDADLGRRGRATGNGEGAATADPRAFDLRGRDLRFARLDRSDLVRADLSGADLEGASFVGADLSRARLLCADAVGVPAIEERSQYRCTIARGADFSGARLDGAQMAGADVRGARFASASLEAADLSAALATSADFANAHLEKAELGGGIQLQGARLKQATLQGANLTGAQLVAADLTGAALQGAVLAGANLAAAKLRDADMEGADLGGAKLWRADLTNTRLRAADLRGASVWMTLPPANDAIALVDFGGLAVKPLDASMVSGVVTAAQRLALGAAKGRIGEALAPLGDQGRNNDWAGSADQQAWQSFLIVSAANAQDSYVKDLTEALGGLMCKPRFAGGAVATGIATRAQGATFRGAASAIYDKLRDKDCAATSSVAPVVLRRLATTIDIAAGK